VSRHRPEILEDYARRLLCAAGLEERHAHPVAGALVGADLLGFTSHGLELLPRYVDELADGRTARSGDPEILRDNGANLTIDGHLLPGAAVIHTALEILLTRAVRHGLVTAAIGRSQHIGCLATYLESATSRGYLILILSSNPGARIVAPFGGVRPTYSPNPLACGIPTEGDPILIDTSMAAVSYNRCRQAKEKGERLAEDYLLAPDGAPTDDPNVLFLEQPGAIRPFGGDHLGYKGFALGLVIEAFTSGLSGFGRSDTVGLSNAVFVLVADSSAFGGAETLRREMSFLAGQCKAAGRTPGNVRMPGESALGRRRRALADGVALSGPLAAALAARARALGVETPDEALSRR
jgi:L-lactate dehydrogenase